MEAKKINFLMEEMKRRRKCGMWKNINQEEIREFREEMKEFEDPISVLGMFKATFWLWMTFGRRKFIQFWVFYICLFKNVSLWSILMLKSVQNRRNWASILLFSSQKNHFQPKIFREFAKLSLDPSKFPAKSSPRQN